MNDGELFYIRNSIEESDMDRYYDEIEKALKTGLFTYFAHPDLFLTIKTEFDDRAKAMSRKLCELCKQYDIPIEINLNGMTWTLPNRIRYPYEPFWEIVGQVGNKVVIGYDAHWPEFFRETKYIEHALDIVKKYNLNLLNKDEIQKYIK